jgi:Tol biopolymer transport system component
MSVYNPDGFWETRSPTWRSDGEKIGYALNFASLLYLPPSPAPLEFGEELTSVDSEEQVDFIGHLTWGPPSRPNDLLYDAQAWDFDEGSSENIYLTTEGSTTVGQRLLTFEVWENVMDVQWLPDGSGFVYTRIEYDEYIQPISANVYLYRFATQTATQVTQFDDEYAGMLNVSPDGQQIVFERGSGLDEFNTEVVDPDLWIINQDGTGLHLLVEDGRGPAWSPQPVEPPPPPSPTPTNPPPGMHRIFLPLAFRTN